MERSSTPALIIFIKNPVLTRVKTRLAKTIGNEAALKAYECLLFKCRQLCDEFNGSRYLYYSNDIDRGDLWQNHLYHKKLQSGNSLGVRMMNAFSEVLKIHNKALIIGSDCPYLQPHHFDQAFDHLEKFDCSIGPTCDGGYYLLGMNALYAELFTRMPWSEPTVFEKTLERMMKRGRTFGVLEMLEDIDTEDDWIRFQSYGA